MKTLVKAAATIAAVSLLGGCWMFGAAGDRAPGVGDRTCAKWQTVWYGATITAREGDEITVRYDDNDTGVVAPTDLKPLLYRQHLKVGMKVLGQWQPRARWYEGTVQALEDDGAVVAWADGSTPSKAPYGRMALPD